MALLTEGFEGGSNGADITTGNTGFTQVASNAPTFSDSNPFAGTLCMKTSTGSSYSAAEFFPSGSVNDIYVRQCVRFDNLPVSAKFYPMGVSYVTNGVVDWRVDTDGTISLRADLVKTWQSTTTLSQGTWYQTVVESKQSTSTCSLSLYDAAGTLIEQSGPQSLTSSGAVDYVKIGCSVASNDVAYIDAVEIDTSPVSPIVATPTGNIKAWDGTAWHVVKAWTGSKWTPVKAWTGSAWV